MSSNPNDVGATATHSVPSQNQAEQKFLRAQLLVPAVLAQARVELRDATIPPPQTQRHTHAARQRSGAYATVLLSAELTLRSR
jgi:hypothetical protein